MTRSYPVIVRRDGFGHWWWHVLHEDRSGWALTKRRAERKAATAILRLEEGRSQQWDAEKAKDVLA